MSNIKFAGKTPMCVKCSAFYSLRNLDDLELTAANETGLCPKCQADAEFKDQNNMKDVIEMVANENNVPVADVVVESVDNEIIVAVKQPSLRPAKNIRNMLIAAIDAGVINNQILTDLCDKKYALKSLGGIKYPFLKEINPLEDIHDQIKINGKARYSTKHIQVGGRYFVMTNDIYAKHLTVFENWASQFYMENAV